MSATSTIVPQPLKHARGGDSVATAEQLPGFGRISRTELRRRLCHMLPGVFALSLSLIPHERPLPMIAFAHIAVLILLAAVLVRQVYPAIARPGETDWTLNIIKYSCTILVVLLLFPMHPEFAAVVVAVVAFGDGSATLLGLLFGRHHLPWNPQKTWEGLVGFMVCSMPLATLAYWLEAEPAVPLHVAATCALTAVVCGQIAESLPLRSSDNLRVGIAAASGVIVAHLICCGVL